MTTEVAASEKALASTNSAIPKSNSRGTGFWKSMLRAAELGPRLQQNIGPSPWPVLSNEWPDHNYNG